MKSRQYLNYIKSLGDKKLFIDVLDEVKRMLQFETEYRVDIDDFIKDNGKINNLRTLNDDGCLLSAIDRYMYMFIDNPKLSPSDYNDDFCPDRFCFVGTREELVEALSDMMGQKDAETLSWHMWEYQDLIDKDEHIDAKFVESAGIPRAVCILVERLEYNINIKALSLMAIALMLDIKLTMGFASTTLGILGVNGQAIVKVSAEAAEMCLISEAILHKPHIIDKEVFRGKARECVHNDYNCKYREESMCRITEKEIAEVLDGLSEKNVFTKIGEQYKYNY